ncbi:hypothetical protein [Streptomyces sp. NPDC091371]|uniref:hypothetical protein n=1 Tax=Streptomyces sp. NPDC091371 TaxID=3155303 RepID=UPI003415E54F
MERITRWYTPLTADVHPERFASSGQPGAVVTVRRPGGRGERFRLMDTPLYGVHGGTFAAEPAEHLQGVRGGGGGRGGGPRFRLSGAGSQSPAGVNPALAYA